MHYVGNKYFMCVRLLLALVAMVYSVAGASGSTTATLYVGRHFEVRDHDQPTKYVFNGPVRVASVVGSLSNNRRLQRIRLFAGWNLCSLAVSGSLAPAPGQNPANLVSGVFRWDPDGRDWVAVGIGESLPLGTVMWIEARTNAMMTVAGSYADPTGQQIETGGSYLPSAGLEAWSPVFAPGLFVWIYDSESNQWEEKLAGNLAAFSDLPPTLAPGEALYINANVASSIEPPAPALRIRYYHQDHLGSSSLITDAQGAVIEETTYFPLGVPRNEHLLAPMAEPYKFTQKERDPENGNYYFEARYLAGALARFLTPDQKYANIEKLAGGDFTGFLTDPQQINLYIYVRNNPLTFTDPTGLGGDPDSGHNDRESEEQLEKNEKYAQGGEAGILGLDLAENLASHGSTLSEVAGGLSIALNVGVAGVKALEFVYHPTAKNAVSLGWHATKAIGTYFAPEVFLPIQGADLALRKMSDYTDEKVASFNAAARSLDKSAKEMNRISSELQDMSRQLQTRTEQLERQTALLNAETSRLKYLQQQEDAANSKQFKEFWHQRQLDTIEYYHKYFGL